MNLELLIKLLMIAMIVQIISIAMVQKIKEFECINTSWIVKLIAIIVNLGLGIAFTLTFTDATLVSSTWVGLFAWLGADTIYKALEEKGLLKKLSKTTTEEDTSIDDDMYVG